MAKVQEYTVFCRGVNHPTTHINTVISTDPFDAAREGLAICLEDWRTGVRSLARRW